MKVSSSGGYLLWVLLVLVILAIIFFNAGFRVPAFIEDALSYLIP